MTPADKRLLLRVAQRMEAAARATYAAAMAANPPQPKAEQAKRTRDNEVGDAMDLKDYVVRMERAAALEKTVAAMPGLISLPREPYAGMKDAGAAVLDNPTMYGTRSHTDVALEIWSAMVSVAVRDQTSGG